MSKVTAYTDSIGSTLLDDAGRLSAKDAQPGKPQEVSSIAESVKMQCEEAGDDPVE